MLKVKRLKNYKSLGEDGIQVKILKMIDKKNRYQESMK